MIPDTTTVAHEANPGIALVILIILAVLCIGSIIFCPYNRNAESLPAENNDERVSKLKKLQNSFADPAVNDLAKQVNRLTAQLKEVELAYTQEKKINANHCREIAENRLHLKGLDFADAANNAEREKNEAIIEHLTQTIKTFQAQKVYAGQRFYNPDKHSAPVVKLGARFNEWLLVLEGKSARPIVMSKDEFWLKYKGYESFKTPDNRKLLS